MVAAVALLAGPALSAYAATPTTPTAPTAPIEQARAAGLTDQQAGELQRQVDAVLARDPQARQTSANTLAIPGATVTLPVPGQPAGAPRACNEGHLCITDGRGVNYDYYRCGYYDFDGIGDGTFNNNQTPGTRARFYNSDGSERWSHVAKGTGTASWTPVYHIRPC
ncbi:hypothetical protein [Streptomyces sp. NPDC094032]|uniref:hypothetical protein n=1 Tax=Streptomyces sp. NPDC094032 TaxID=3155308 RepID=UPI003317B6A9